MRTVTRTATALATTLCGVALVASAAPAGAVTAAPSPTATGTATASGGKPTCVLNATAAAREASSGSGIIAQITVTAKPRRLPDGSLALAVRVDSLFREAKVASSKAVRTLVVPKGCSLAVAAKALPKDVYVVVGAVQGSQLRASGVGPSLLQAEDACEVEKAVGSACKPAPVRVGYEPLNPPATHKWLQLAAPGLAAVIVSVLGLFLLRLRRR